MKNAARKILLIQGGLGESVGLAPERSGYPVTWVRTAKSALTHVERDKPVLVIVDLPSLRVDAAKLCQSIKRITETNVLFLGAEGQDAAAAGCDACGDGYIARPLQLRRVMAKVEKLMPAGHAAELRCGELILRPADGMLRKRGEEIRLNPKLSRLLQLFMQHQGEIITRKLLMQQVWRRPTWVIPGPWTCICAGCASASRTIRLNHATSRRFGARDIASRIPRRANNNV
ncbi:MAG: response regulator transcription factor [Anaerolineae bacterium]|nr:response regulator transcription factor [Anaerolineae bacterium]